MNAAVGFTVTTLEDRVSRFLEGNAPPVSSRLKALKRLNGAGVKTYAFVGPMLPYFTAKRSNPPPFVYFLYFQTLERCLSVGQDALVIKSADTLDNSYCYHPAEGDELRRWLLEKLEHFVRRTEHVLGNEKVRKRFSSFCITLDT